MASAREMRLRIKSVKNISQVTRALEAVSAAKVRKAIQALTATRSYATKAWQVLTHITNQPGSREPASVIDGAYQPEECTRDRDDG